MKPFYLLLFGVLVACSTSNMDPTVPCTDGNLRLSTEFPAGGGTNCVRTATGFELTISPEAQPINKSPWYAFDLTTTGARQVEVTLVYGYGKHRYHPKRLDNDEWVPLPEDSVVESSDETVATLTIDLSPGTTRIAAQPVLAVQERRDWIWGLEDRTHFEAGRVGSSVDGIPIYALLSQAARNDAPLILLLGGQHPPEVPGSLAMRHFLERLAGDDALATTFRTHLEIAAMPMLNPDGIDDGHWRANRNLVDLNRDWGPFTQPETQAAQQVVAMLEAEGHRPVLMIDFHATWRGDLVYTPSGPDFLKWPDFMPAWAAGMDQRLTEPSFEFVAGHNPDLPTARSWFTETYGAHGLTLEIGDETDPARIKRLSVAAAEAMMETVLDEMNLLPKDMK